MTNSVAIYFNKIVVTWPSLLIFLGILACITMTLTLWKPKNRSSAGLWLFFLLALVLGFFFSRDLHWYFNKETYVSSFGAGDFASFRKAFTDFSIGSYSLPGVMIGVLLAAGIVSLLGYVSKPGRLLDFAAPGLLLLAALIRLSSFFNSSCRGKRPVTLSLLQRLPFCVAVTDAAGNVSYRLAVFFLEFLLLMIAFFVVLAFFLRKRNAELYEPCGLTGHVWRRYLLYYSCIEILMDSLRTDKPLMHFSYLTSLNAYSAFISFAQVTSAFFLAYVFIYYVVSSARVNRFRWKHLVSILVFVVSLVGVGFFGEYSIQRYGSTVTGYISMIVSLIAVIVNVKLLYRSCEPQEDLYD